MNHYFDYTLDFLMGAPLLENIQSVKRSENYCFEHFIRFQFPDRITVLERIPSIRRTG